MSKATSARWAATDDGTRLILCYSSTEKPSTDPYELTIKSVLTNNTFHKNPTLVITDGTQVLSTNSTIVEELGTSQYHALSTTIDWKDDALTCFKYQGTSYYGLHRVYGNYFVYAVYASEEVFSTRSHVIAYGFLLYLILCVIILMIQRHQLLFHLSAAYCPDGAGADHTFRPVKSYFCRSSRPL